jgi:hypothetical protein
MSAKTEVANTVMNNAMKKVYNKIAKPEILPPREALIASLPPATVPDKTLTDSVTEPRTINAPPAPVVVASVPAVAEKSWFGTTYNIFGYDLSILTLIIIAVVIGVVIYYLASYMGWIGKAEEPKVVIVNEPVQPTVVEVEEDEEEEEEDEPQETKKADAEVCDLKARK